MINLIPIPPVILLRSDHLIMNDMFLGTVLAIVVALLISVFAAWMDMGSMRDMKVPGAGRDK